MASPTASRNFCIKKPMCHINHVHDTLVNLFVQAAPQIYALYMYQRITEIISLSDAKNYKPRYLAFILQKEQIYSCQPFVFVRPHNK